MPGKQKVFWLFFFIMMLLLRLDADIPPFQQSWSISPKSHLHIMVFWWEKTLSKFLLLSEHPGSTGTLGKSCRSFFNPCPNSPQLVPIHPSCPNSPQLAVNILPEIASAVLPSSMLIYARRRIDTPPGVFTPPGVYTRRTILCRSCDVYPVYLAFYCQ